MRLLASLTSFVLALALSGGEAPAQAPRVPDPFELPAEAVSWIRQASFHGQGQKAALQSVLSGIFKPQEEGGLGLVYDNSRTRTVTEVWQERRANCISLTAFFVSAARTLGYRSDFAEPVNTNRWYRNGPVIRHERHLVALVPIPPLEDVVADFLPNLRKRAGSYIVTPLTDRRVRALWHCNRSVEALEKGLHDLALQEIQEGLTADPTSATAWNTRGVLEMTLGHMNEAEASLKQAVSLDAKDGTPVGNLEVLYRTLGQDRDAARCREQGVVLRQKDPYFNAFMAEEAFVAGRFEEATDRIGKAIKLMPFDADFYLLQARISLIQGRPADARKSLTLAKRWAAPGERAKYDSKLEALAKL